MGAWDDADDSDEEEETVANTNEEEGDGSSSGSSESEDSEAESPEHGSRSRSADPTRDDDKINGSKLKNGKHNNLTGSERQGQEVPDSRPKTSDTGTDHSRASGSSMSKPPLPLPHPVLLKNLQATSGQEVGLGSIDLTNARVAFTNNHIVIQRNTILDLPESWNPAPLPPRRPDHLAEAVLSLTNVERSRDISSDNG